MKITFAGIVIADGEHRTASVASRLKPSADVQMQVLDYLRAEWAVPVARGNRIVSLPVVIQWPQCADFGEALIQALMFVAELPEEGELIVEHAGSRVTFSTAVCPNVETEEIEGVSNAVKLLFVCGKPTSTLLIVDENEEPLQDENGNDLEF